MLEKNYSNEIELIEALINYKKIEKEKIIKLICMKLDWSFILGQLVYNRIAGIAFHVLLQCEIPKWSINREFYFNLYLLYEVQSIRSKFHVQQVIEIAKALSKTDIPHAFLKGSMLSAFMYPLGCRISSDIDLLINSDDITMCGKILKELGFIQGYYNSKEDKIVPAPRTDIILKRTNYGEIVPYVKLINEPCYNYVQIDVNFSLDWLANDTKNAVHNFLDKTVIYHSDKLGDIRSLSMEYFLAHLCVHLHKEAVLYQMVESQRDLCLYKFEDIYTLLLDDKFKIDIDTFRELILTNGIEKECYFALTYTSEVFPSLKETSIIMELINCTNFKDYNYLNLVIDAKDTNIKYKWENGLKDRLYDLNRVEKLIRIN